MVQAALDDYRRENDPLCEFLEQRCVIGKECCGAAADLYAAYLESARAAGIRPISQAQFGRTLGKRGFEKGHRGPKIHRQREWRGIALREN